jgi:hypothetical protein
MSNPEKSYKGCGVVILALFILSLVTNVWLIQRGQVEPEPQVVIEHDTLWRDTTITHPTPTASTQTGRTIFIPYLVTDTIRQNDTLMVEVPVEQKRYDDSLYTAWVSGYQPALDSIRLHQPEVITTITETIVKKTPRLSVGLSVGPGISIDKDHHMGIYVGFTANYRLWPK